MTNHDIAIKLTDGERGSFMRHIGHAYCMADSTNRQHLEIAFPHVFTQHSEADLHVVVSGNPVDGLEFSGPFESREAAIAHGENMQPDWWVAPLIRPTPD